MPKPVLVIHGVANRDKQAFLDEVNVLSQNLQQAGGDYSLIPVWWGDIAEQNFDVDAVLPLTIETRGGNDADIAFGMDIVNAPSVATNAAPAAAPPVRVVRDSNTAQQIVAGAAVASAGPVRAGNPLADQQVQAAIREQWNQTENLQRIQDAETLKAIGQAIGEAIQNADASPSGPTLVRGFGDGLKHFVSGVLAGLDKGVGAVVGSMGGTINEYLRGSLGPGLTRFLGDIFIYQHNRDAIQKRLWDAIDQFAPGMGVEGSPISVVAHSLGSVISFDTAISGARRLWIDGFVTFGGQPSYFYVMDSSGDGLPVYQSGQQTALPASIRRWTNIWEPLDILAFLQGRVFQLASGESPTDTEMAHLASAGLWTHSSYWMRPELVEAIRNTV